jgi:hypothetical protein
MLLSSLKTKITSSGYHGLPSYDYHTVTPTQEDHKSCDPITIDSEDLTLCC